MSKVRVAFFDFACCEGCQLNVLNCEDKLLDILNNIEIVNFREAMSEASDNYDIAFIEGSITRECDIPRLKKIRENAKILITLGSCSSIGGVNAIKNNFDLEDVRNEVYGNQKDYFETTLARPIDAVVKVDYKIYGCPIHREEFVRIITSLLAGQQPYIPNHPVCVECKLKDNFCVFDKGMTCLGPLTRAGCGARCPSEGNYCVGCRGMVDEPEVNAHFDILKKYNLSIDDIKNKFEIYYSYYRKKFENIYNAR
ncbi:MAG TPA: hypothetical protein PLD27_01445 [bacterium]|nr:hypothetical protein [bacterium]HOL46623.1 hypothetical protein [bacterium]HPQ17806.1 hypothetical protein [bacterium]